MNIDDITNLSYNKFLDKDGNELFRIIMPPSDIKLSFEDECKQSDEFQKIVSTIFDNMKLCNTLNKNFKNLPQDEFSEANLYFQKQIKDSISWIKEEDKRKNPDAIEEENVADLDVISMPMYAMMLNAFYMGYRMKILNLNNYITEQITYYQELVDMGDGAHNSGDMIEFEAKLDTYQSIQYKLNETRQSIPREAIDEFKFTGLNNTDMFASNFLTRYNLKNIYDK